MTQPELCALCAPVTNCFLFSLCVFAPLREIVFQESRP